MSFGLYDRERRRRQQTVLNLLKTIAYVGVVCATGAFAYQFGVEQMKGQDALLRAEVARLQDENDQLAVAAQQLRTAGLLAENRSQELERRYAQDVPRGDHARLLQIARERLNGGVTVERLAFVLQNARMPRACEETETRRFVVLTPIAQPSPNSAVRFGNGAITVSATGQSAKSRDGNPEGWFDPGQPVTVKFTPIGGRNEATATGTLPLSHALVANNTEWRFTVMSGPRSFVEVTADRCPFP